jgi:hypothetical protein
MSADAALNYLVRLIAGLALPASILIVASWRVARMRGVTEERINESVAETLKEQLRERVIDPLFAANNIVLPPGKTSYDILNILVPADNVALLANMYDELSRLGVDCNTYQLLLQTAITLWGGG